MFYGINMSLFLVSLAFVIEDESLVGVTQMFNSPYMYALSLFVFLLFLVKMSVRCIWVFFAQNIKNSVFRYQRIEDRLYMEEYEDPEQQFHVKDSPNYNQLLKLTEDAKFYSINQNLVKVHRSDSIDQILDRINISGGQSAEGRNNFTNKQMINKFNLKLNDINKEIEYN